MAKNADKPNKRNWIPEKYFQCFQDALDNYMQAHPHWDIEVLASVIKWGIRNLKQSIEQEVGGNITWEAPLIELHYPVEWDWKSPREGDVVYGKRILGTLTKENTSSRNNAVKTLAQMITCRLNTMALGQLTNEVAFEKRNGKCVRFLPAKLETEFRRIKGKWKKVEALEVLFKPFWIGTTRIDVPDVMEKTNASIPRRVAKRLEIIGQRMDIPGIAFSEDVNGRKMWCGLVFEIQPLNIDYDEHRAYYPITIGLAFEHRQSGNDIIALTPSEWPRNDRETFWKNILHSIEEYFKVLIPQNETESSIILVQNDKILKIQPLHCRKDIKVAMKLLECFPAKLKKEQAIAKQGERRLHLLKECDLAKTADDKGRALENLMKELFNTTPGLKVVDSRVKTQTEEIDLVLSRDGKTDVFNEEEEYILVECKKWSTKCGKDEFVLFEKKMRNRKGRSSLGFLISWNGFTDTVKKEMLRESHERLVIVPLDGVQIRGAVQQNNFLSLLTLQRQDAIFD